MIVTKHFIKEKAMGTRQWHWPKAKATENHKSYFCVFLSLILT